MRDALLRRLESEVGELLDRHESTRDLSEFAQYKDDPVGFIRDVLGGEPWSKQEEISEAIRDRPLVVVQGCNASGKDWLAARLALWWVFARQGFVVIQAASQRQVRNIVFREIRAAWNRARLPGELYEQLLRVDRDENIGIIGMTSSDSSKLQGFHAARVLGILSEAQGIEPYGWEAMFACAVSEDDRLLAIGNPTNPSGTFFTSSRSANWHTIRVSAFDHINLTEGRTIIPGGPSQAFVDRIAAEYGKESGIYQARILGEFPSEDEYGLVSREWLEKAAGRHEAATKAGFIEGRYEPIIAVDPARFGPDQTVVASTLGPMLTRLTKWEKLDTMETTGRIIEECRRAGVSRKLDSSTEYGEQIRTEEAIAGTRRWSFGVSRLDAWGTVIVDEVGIGSGVADRLKELSYKVIPFNGGRSARNGRKFLNLRAESYWSLRTLLEGDDVAIPHDEQLWEELVSVTWRPNSGGKIQLEAKDDLRSRLGRSPDRADSVSMAFWYYQAFGAKVGFSGCHGRL